MNTWKKITSILLTIIGILCLIGAGILLARYIIADRQADAALEELRVAAEAVKEDNQGARGQADSADITTTTSVDSAGISTDTPASATTASPDNEETDSTDATQASDASATETATPAVPNPYKDSYLANEDMVGWLQIADTKIDYPVMWTPRDENYYLYRDFDGSDNQNGCLILDTDSSLEPLTTNLIIHGHNMRSGAMFGNLTDYESQAYYEKHKNIVLYTEECQRNYEVIAVFRSQVYKKSDQVFKFYKFFQADTREEFDDFYQNIKKLSIYDTGVTAEFGDHFITLSTCVYHVEQGRFVVVAKEVDTGDTYLPVEE